MASKISELQSGRMAPTEEPRRILDDARASAASFRQIRNDGRAMSAIAPRQLAALRQAGAGSSLLEAAALQAALGAWDQAFRAPSVHGLPSAAGVSAYRRISPEAEEIVRARLAAALALRHVHHGTA